VAVDVPRVVIGAKTEQHLVALTFDLDMTPQMETQLQQGVVSGWVNQDALAVLRSSGTPATLFMTGMWAELYPGLARTLAQEPQFEIENHSYSHPAFHLPCYLLGGVSRAGAAWQLSHAQAVIGRITGVTPRYFRFPGGCYDAAALDAVHSAGLIPVEWTVNGMDAFNPNATGVAAAVMAQVRPGAIVMMHLQGGPNAPATGSALRIIIPALRRRGYQLVTVAELLRGALALQPPNPDQAVQAYQPSPTPTPSARPIPAVVQVPPWRPARAAGTIPALPCWRWNPTRRIWLRC
jgi:peptidoglycan/xylan/chitin deacetylase (PgdA/CDA1 family)